MTETTGVIIRALSGFYYVRADGREIVCRARGSFRSRGITPLVGDRVTVQENVDGSGTVTDVHPRRNAFVRPSAANIDLLVMIASAAIPVTDPYLIDRVSVRCRKNNCDLLIVINKIDLADGAELAEIYRHTPYPMIRVSASTGEGIDDLRAALSGKICCFTGNSGVGKSSILNALNVSFSIPVAEVSRKLGRGKHTTRHVELYDLGGGTFVADTPGFASFGDEDETPISKYELPGLFPEFAEYAEHCRFDDCTHRREPGCGVREALQDGTISQSRYDSYLRLYEEAAAIPDWQLPQNNN